MSFILDETWLKQWVEFDETPEALAERFSLLGLECVAHDAPVVLTHVVVGRVLEAKAHPDADRLKVCTVDVGEPEMLSIVCGDPTVEAQMVVPVARIGARLPGGKIKKSKIRGVRSQGMLCSAQDLGLEAKSNGLMRLDASLELGHDVANVIELPAAKFEFDLTPNRGDCLSALGIARELAMDLGCTVQRPAVNPVRPQIQDGVTIKNTAPHACPKYLARVIKGIDPTRPLPAWLIDRLALTGIHQVHPVVDILNYVMIEYGQPMHAYDLQHVQEGVQIREAREGEQFMLLDHSDFIGLGGELLIVDGHDAPLALAGIMGGLDSGIQNHTTDILLECASFNAEMVCATTQRHQLHSESSARYARGVDPSLPELAIERATALLLACLGGQAGESVAEIAPDALKAEKVVTVSLDWVQRNLGVALDPQALEAKLTALELSPDFSDGAWHFKIPPHRSDLQHQADLLEEIARCYGYDRIPAQTVVSVPPADPGSLTAISDQRLADAFQALGYQEVVNYSFVDPELEQSLHGRTSGLILKNPLSSETSVMRTSLFQGLLTVARENFNRRLHAFGLYEVGVCFEAGQTQHDETSMLAMLLTGQRSGQQWGRQTTTSEFFDLKGDIECLFDRLGMAGQLQFKTANESMPIFHPGCAADIFWQGQPVGVAGSLHPVCAKALDIHQPIYLLTIQHDVLKTLRKPTLKAVSKFPYVERDLTIEIDKSIHFDDIAHVVTRTAGQYLTVLRLFDLYEDQCLNDQARQSLSMKLRFQSKDRTLLDADLNTAVNTVAAALIETFKVEIKGYE